LDLGSTTLAWHQPAEGQPRIQPPNSNIVVGLGSPQSGTTVHPAIQDFSPTGIQLFHALGEGTPIDAETNVDVDGSGNIYLGTLTFGTGSHFRSLNPNGSLRWQFRDDDTATSPAVSPLETLVLYSAAGYDAPSHVNALNTANGQLLWREDLPVENGGNIQVSSAPRFASDGSTAYLGTVVNATDDTYSYLYAFITGSSGLYAADGLDDAWQAQYFGQNNPQADPNADPDADGRTNLQEFIEGSVPTDPASRLTIQVLPVPGQPTQTRIVFSPIIAGRSYTVEYATAMGIATASPAWYALSGAAQSDAGSVRTVTDTTIHNSGSCIYRVRSGKP
jgi:hypothetical protein